MSTIIEPLEFKIIIVGDSGVGKTCLIDTFCGRTFNLNSSSTIGKIHILYLVFTDWNL